MRFEVINDKNKIVMQTSHMSCIPDKNTLNSMQKAGYKFKLNGKTITIKKLSDKIEEVDDEKNNQN